MPVSKFMGKAIAVVYLSVTVTKGGCSLGIVSFSFGFKNDPSTSIWKYLKAS